MWDVLTENPQIFSDAIGAVSNWFGGGGKFTRQPPGAILRIFNHLRLRPPVLKTEGSRGLGISHFAEYITACHNHRKSTRQFDVPLRVLEHEVKHVKFHTPSQTAESKREMLRIKARRLEQVEVRRKQAVRRSGSLDTPRAHAGQPRESAGRVVGFKFPPNVRPPLDSNSEVKCNTDEEQKWRTPAAHGNTDEIARGRAMYGNNMREVAEGLDNDYDRLSDVRSTGA